MAWRALLRLVDVQALLTAQPAVADALARAQRAHGPRSDEARALREGYNLLAKVLWTRRAAIPQVHDLVWLDHAVVSSGALLGKTYGADADERTWNRLAERVGVLADLAAPAGPPRWLEVSVDAFDGASPVKMESGRTGPYRVGLVPQDRLSAIGEAVRAVLPADGTEKPILADVESLAAAGRRVGTSGVVLAFVAASL